MEFSETTSHKKTAQRKLGIICDKFGSINALATAAKKDMKNIRGIGAQTVKKVRAAFDQKISARPINI